MSDSRELRIEPTPPTSGAPIVQPVRAEERPAAALAEQRPEPDRYTVAATTGGPNLRAAYAQFVVNPDTNDVVIRIRDSSTDEVLRELPSPEVEAVNKALRDYADALARHRAAMQSGSVS